jgi:spectinomycin phosphotransferase
VLGEHGIHAASLRFLPIGADGHNYRAEGLGGPWFVSVKRAAAHTEPARGTNGLERSYSGARRLRTEAGIDFLSLALPRTDGGYVSALAGRPVVVQRWLDGESHQDLSKQEATAVLALVRRLHAATAVVSELDLPPETFDTAFVPVLEDALRRVMEGRDVGPHSAWLRATLTGRYAQLRDMLARFRTSRERVLGRGREGWVVTHGEPHGANVVWTPTGPMLVDCGELRLAPPERDLVAMEIVGNEEVTLLYQRRWVLAEIAEYADRLARPHGDDAEDRRARDQLLLWLEGTG